MKAQSINSECFPQWHHALAPCDLGYQLKLVAQLTYREFQSRLEKYDLTPFHYLVLCCLWAEDGLATSSIADQLKQLGATLTGVLDRMEGRGIVRRERDSQDRRIWRVWLTEAGMELEGVLPPIAAATLEKCFYGLSNRDRQKLSQLLTRVVANLT